MNLFFNLALNFLLAVIWLFVTESYTGLNLVVGLVVGYVGIGLTDPSYAVRVWRASFFAVYVAYQIVKSALTVTAVVLSPSRKPNPGIVAIPLEIDSHIEIILLATVITLTPGTISVETGRSQDGRGVLFVHCLQLDNPEEMRRSIKEDFERRIIGFMQPAREAI